MMKKAFTLIELIIVIVILAILATFATNIYSNIYQNYVYARTVDQLETKTQVVLDQISARLSKRVHSATIGRVDIGSNDIANIESVDERDRILEWLGQSDIGQKIGVKNRLGWTGFVYLEDSNISSTIKTPGSMLQFARENIQSATSKGIDNLGLVFAGVGGNKDKFKGYGFIEGDPSDTYKVALADLSKSTQDVMAVKKGNFKFNISQRYYLIDSAYALVPTTPQDYTYTYKGKKETFKDFNLTLYYDYRPWLGETLADAKQAVLASHVTLFRFRGDYNSIDIKLCLRSPSIPNIDFVVCKTKVVE